MADLYKEAGVNIDAGNEAVTRIKSLVKKTFNPQVLSELGSFGGLYALPVRDYRDPVLVSSTDGVGTKLKVAFALEKYDTIGYDLVNHCVNDILVQGARPLFFLDYIGTGVLKPAVVEAIVSGLARGCLENQCVLIGGETAEMPGIYSDGEFDLAGTIVGIVERDLLITGAGIAPGDLVLGLASTGLHTNGYSLARKICFETLQLKPTDKVDSLNNSIGLELLKPHRSYFNELYPLIARKLVKGLAHITGGGFYDNIPRILPDGCEVQIKKNTWQVPPIFQMLQKAASIPDSECYRVFNMGIGMAVVCSPDNLESIKTAVPEIYQIGQVVAGEKKVTIVE
jgi:phosphoribosylformylglycinamidine cyclo-ligase